MSPFELREMLVELKAKTPGINKILPVVDDSMLANKVSDLSSSDNMVLVGVLPRYASNGQNVDNVRTVPVTMLMVLEKCDYSGLSEDQFWEKYERTFQTIQKIKDEIIRMVSDDCPGYLSAIDVNSMEITPVWGKVECCGWTIDLDFE